MVVIVRFKAQKQLSYYYNIIITMTGNNNRNNINKHTTESSVITVTLPFSGARTDD